MSAIEVLCPRSLYLVGGALAATGPTAEVVSSYLENRQALTRWAKSSTIKVQDGLVLEHLRLVPSNTLSGEPVDIEILFNAGPIWQIR